LSIDPSSLFAVLKKKLITKGRKYENTKKYKINFVVKMLFLECKRIPNKDAEVA